jgi:hypothetical protein
MGEGSGVRALVSRASKAESATPANPAADRENSSRRENISAKTRADGDPDIHHSLSVRLSILTLPNASETRGPPCVKTKDPGRASRKPARGTKCSVMLHIHHIFPTHVPIRFVIATRWQATLSRSQRRLQPRMRLCVLCSFARRVH